MDTPSDYIEVYTQKKDEIEKTLDDILQIIQSVSKPEDLEGNSFYRHRSIERYDELFYKQINLTWAGSKATQKICEIGFNAGHSAYLLLLSNSTPNLQFTIFDIGEHEYTVPCLKYIASKYKDTVFFFTKGDSTLTIPSFISNFTSELSSYDIVHVDGGHSFECACSDIICANLLLKSGGYMIIDDTNVDYISEMVDKLITGGNYKEIQILPTLGYQHRILQKL
jgi:hypothetical protein